MVVSRHLLLVVAVGVMLAAAPNPMDAHNRQLALGITEPTQTGIAAVDAQTARLGRAPAMWGMFLNWAGSSNFPGSFLTALAQRSIMPVISWEPTDGSSDCTRWSLDNITKGGHDAYVRQWATDAKQYGGPIILRFAHEMEGYWFIWGNGRCTNTPAKFRVAWRHVWQIFRDVGATNVKFLWSPNGGRNMKVFYPGDKYTDYVGFSAYDWGRGPNVNGRWLTMVQTFAPKMTRMSSFTRKPIIIAEMGAAYLPNCAACDKVAYIQQGYPAVYRKWPQIKGLLYFDLDATAGGARDWRLSSPPGALDAYRAIVADRRFQGSIP